MAAPTSGTPSINEQALREDLAAAFRLAVQFNWHESVGNHFSAAVSEDGRQFLLNPRWQHFSTIKASDLLCLSVDDDSVMDTGNAPDPSAWCIHGSVHANRPSARVLLHCHPPNTTALCTLADPSLKSIDQNTARFHNRYSVDLGFSGLADDAAEGARIANAFGNHQVLMMGNHGVSVCGETVADAFETLYFLERAAHTQILAYSSGKPLNIMKDDVAERTAQGWEAYSGMAEAHFAHLKAELDRTDPSYKD